MLEQIIAADGAVLLWIQEVVRNGVLTPILSVYTKLGDMGILWILLSLLLLCRKKTRRAGMVSLLALFLGFLCTNVVLKHLVGRTRPWLVVEGLTALVFEGDPNSFPSGHTCAAFAAAGAWCHTLPRRWMKVLGIGMAALMGFSRLYVGVHFPSDVLVGCVVGLVCSQLAWLLWTRLQPRLQRARGAE